ncbi:GntR family transcriptional regulator [Agrobacterium vitis]|uniref:GntR family transcriptional regulator n=1 Tax=Agrobacterium vitis TaxID=373 RepID=UPI0015DA26F5|nr:GntR family transcriptional regulator [Agrobacterium vitis]
MSISIPDRIYADLRSKIISHELAPSSSLKIEALSAQFHTSTIPVREALVRLCNDGLVVQENRQGFSVRPVTPKSLEDDYRTLAAILQLAAAELTANAKSDRSSEGGIALEELTKNDGAQNLDRFLLSCLPSKQLAMLGNFCLLHSRYFQRIDFDLRGEKALRNFISRRQRAATALIAGRVSTAQKLIAEERDWRIENIPSVIREMLFRQLST